MIVDLFFLVLGVLFLLIMGYLFFLAGAGLFIEEKRQHFEAQTRFGIIIPAHNEAELIADTLERLALIQYPADLIEIIVIADNCDDQTAQIARKHRISCLGRREPNKKGKGFALGWAFPRLLEMGDHDAYVVIDADTHLAPDFLQVVNTYFCRGEKVVQGYSQARHPERSPLESLSFLGFALNRNLRYLGRSRLGWSGNLMGTGMCFSREVIAELGWQTVTLVEDIEYQMFLILHDIRVAFAGDAHLDVELHDTLSQTRSQRTRWDMGKFEVRNQYLPHLFKAGFMKREAKFFDSAMELLLPPFSMFVFLVFTCTGLFFLLDYQGLNINFFLWLTVISSLLLYIFIGLLTARADAKVYRALFYAPFFLGWRLWILCRERLQGNRKRQW